MARRRRQGASLGCLFWIAFILLIAVLFFLNKNNIAHVLEKTNALEVLFGSRQVETLEPEIALPSDALQTQGDAEFIGEIPPTQGLAAQPEQAATAAGEAQIKPESLIQSEQKPPETKAAEPSTPAQEPEQPPAQKPREPVQAPARPPAAKPAETPPQRTSEVLIYFVTVDSDGKITRHEVKRTIPYTQTPLATALNALFAGPTAQEQAKGLRSFISPGTKLRSARIKDKVATISLSEEFQFNQYGIEGALAQLAQVVFTATSFPTVDEVQILIEGEKKSYLGAEGVWIGSPLSRNKF